MNGMNPLSTIKVLDLTRVLAGPWASQMLADLGAEVIKVERPIHGDETRSWGPPYLRDEEQEETSESAYYLCANRGKKSVCLDIKSSEGRQAIIALAKQSDVFMENFKVGGLEKYGLDYTSLKKINPALIYCSITGFGQTGPYADRPGYDFLVQAMGGLMSVTGSPDEKGGAPQKIGVAVSDIMTGMYASNAILAALFERKSSGLGQHIDLSLFDVTAATLANQASNHLISGNVPSRLGNAHPNIVPYQSFDTADHPCIIAVGNDQQFIRFCQLIGLPELALNKRYAQNADRVKSRDQLSDILQAKMSQKPRHYWLEACEKAEVPAAPINSIDQVFKDPQIQAREMVITVKHPDKEDLPLVANPIKFSRTPIRSQTAPPKLGEHTEEVLDRLKPNIKPSS